MGLDHYLYKKTYVQNWKYMNPEQLHTITVKKGGKKRKDIKPERISYIIETICRWRKFNALHKWFVDNVQGGCDDCKEYHVSIDKLKELITVLKQVITHKPVNGGIVDEKMLESLLPTTSGFFFGCVEFDQYYFNNVEKTIEILEDVLVENNECGDFYYDSSW